MTFSDGMVLGLFIGWAIGMLVLRSSQAWNAEFRDIQWRYNEACDLVIKDLQAEIEALKKA